MMHNVQSLPCSEIETIDSKCIKYDICNKKPKKRRKLQNVLSYLNFDGAQKPHGDIFYCNVAEAGNNKHVFLAKDTVATVLDGVQGGVAVVEADGRLRSCNRNFRAVLNVPDLVARQDVASLSDIAEILARQSRDPQQFWTSPFAAWLMAPQGRLEAALPDGRWFQLAASPIAASRMVIEITEISHYKAQEKRLRAQVTALTNAIATEAEATRKQREYLAMAAHEFRTPMAIIDATAQRLARPGGAISAAEIKERAGNIRRMVVRLTGLIERTISLAEVDAGKVSFAPRPNDIRRLIEDACHRQRESSPGASLSLDMQNLPAEMMLDHFLVEHVLSNILSNAIKYSPSDSPIFITCFLNDGFVHIAVKDYGVGIPASEIPLLFSRFFRASTSAGFQGTGIGLHLCKQFVEMHGGSVDVISHVGFGSTFIIRLPVGMADLSHP